jgi:hypothetical protein
MVMTDPGQASWRGGTLPVELWADRYVAPLNASYLRQFTLNLADGRIPVAVPGAVGAEILATRAGSCRSAPEAPAGTGHCNRS